MSIFTDTEPDRPRRRRGRRIGWVILVLGVVCLFVVGRMPSSYAIERPGPVFNTLGTTEVSGHEVPVITIAGHKTYPTGGALDMLTVNIDGDPDQPASWAEVAGAWFQPSQAITPLDELYAPQQTVKQSNEEGAQQMAESQQDATAAALYEQKIPFDSVLTVGGTVKGSPAEGVLKKGDILDSVNGKTFIDLDQVHNYVVANGTTEPLTIVFTRDGKQMTTKITPAKSSTGPYIGVFLTAKYTFPFPVKIQLQDVGGPSAGMMFALGIIDKLTPTKLNGGQHIAGTGTITASGSVGAIGGIRQKMYGARNAGANYFLAPASNCNEVRGHIPAGLTVFATSKLSDSVTDLHAIATGTGLSKLKTCG
ncbi:MAG TPA: S16 family serine protease [Galbitalea sp.]